LVFSKHRSISADDPVSPSSLAKKQLFFEASSFFSCQRGPTTFDLRAILQKCDNLQATSNKTMHKTADSQDLNLKGENRWVK